MANNVLTERLAEPLEGSQTATVDIDTDSGNLTIDTLGDNQQLLASGTLQYFEKQGHPAHSLASNTGQAVL
ncbi:MAG TPA: hypothetical protein VFT99_04070, partial [Roseiflexaceae bacterium]|nr:hypothetical protein [Roseiflexaceae bacterium]